MTNYCIHFGEIGLKPHSYIVMPANSALDAFNSIHGKLKNSVMFITDEDPEGQVYSRYYLDNPAQFINPEILF